MSAIAKFTSTVATAKVTCESTTACVAVPQSTTTPIVSYGGLPGPGGNASAPTLISQDAGNELELGSDSKLLVKHIIFANLPTLP